VDALEPAPHLAAVAERLRVVTVEVAGGAGIAWAPDLVVTNAHVARAPVLRVRLADERLAEARVIAADRRADLALLRLPCQQPAVARLGDSDALCVGSLVVALGHPLGRRRALAAGIVHAVGPVSRAGRRWIHADVRLWPGNSGGPLADPAGRVIGINTMVAGGLALAIPVAEVRRFAEAALATPA
jgi:serine protease Do